MRVFLIGYRGTGKTTIAALLAKLLDCDWMDSDEQVERMACKSIATIFAEDGEGAFRDWEVKAIGELVHTDHRILALGGGAVLRNENRRTMSTGGIAIWLTASPETIQTRLSKDPTTGQRRPRLTSTGGVTEVRKLLRERTPLYEQCADHTIDTEGKLPQQVTDEIFALLPPMT